MVPAFVYVMYESIPPGRPEPGYVSVCQEGYERFGFDAEILQRALRESQKS